MKWEFPANFAYPLQAIREDEVLNARYPDMPTCSEEDAKKRFTDLLNEIYPQCPVIVVDFTVPPWTMREECEVE